MQLIANYSSLGDVAEGEPLPLWGVVCVLTNIGTRRAPQFVYLTDVPDEDAQELLANGRFREAGNITVASADENPSLEDDDDDLPPVAEKKQSAKDKMAGSK